MRGGGRAPPAGSARPVPDHVGSGAGGPHGVLDQRGDDVAREHLGGAQQHFEAIGDLDGDARMADAVAGLTHHRQPVD